MPTIRKTLKDKDGNYICPAIPSRSIDGGDIKLDTIKAENIDFTTFTTFSGTLPQGDTTIALTTGKWFVTAFGTTLVNGSDTPGIHFIKNGTVIKESFSGNTPSPIWQNISVQDIVEIDDGDTFVIRFGFGIDPKRAGYCCIRVG